MVESTNGGWQQCLNNFQFRRILMILTMTKYHENLLRNSALSLLSTVKIFSSLETEMILKLPNETFLGITRVTVCVRPLLA